MNTHLFGTVIARIVYRDIYRWLLDIILSQSNFPAFQIPREHHSSYLIAVASFLTPVIQRLFHHGI